MVFVCLGFFCKIHGWIEDFWAQLRSAFRPLQFSLRVALASEQSCWVKFSPFKDINLSIV